jgi:hypothetical protein
LARSYSSPEFNYWSAPHHLDVVQVLGVEGLGRRMSSGLSTMFPLSVAQTRMLRRVKIDLIRAAQTP